MGGERSWRLDAARGANATVPGVPARWWVLAEVLAGGLGSAAGPVGGLGRRSCWFSSLVEEQASALHEAASFRERKGSHFQMWSNKFCSVQCAVELTRGEHLVPS